MKNAITRLLYRALNRNRPTAATCDSPLLPHIDPPALLPADALIRLGTTYGGWLIPTANGLDAGSTCYLAGAGEDISFDCELAVRFHCAVRIIDPTPRAIEHFRQLENAVRNGRNFSINNSSNEFYAIGPQDFDHLVFLPIGLADEDMELKFFLPKNPAHVSCSIRNLQRTKDYFTAQCHRLATIMSQQGDSRVDLLKMDIEGAEYSVIRDMVSHDLLPHILLIEFDEAHTPLDRRAHNRIGEHIRLLVRAGMRCIAVEGSNATFVQER